jgi:flagellar basal body rod protein FlgG
MNIGLYQSAASLSALERWQDAVAQNITSAQVTGFKKRTVEFASMPMGEIQTDPRAKFGDGEAALFPKASYTISFQPGETQPTRRELDVAIQGEGFLEVQMPDGTTGYTRAGELHIRPDRTLTTPDGNPILTDNGSPISLLPQGGDISITHEGAISQGGNQLGRLAVVKFADTSQLIPLAGGIFASPAGKAPPTPVDNPQVLQGYLESSNVTPLREMVALVQIARAYEANQKIMTSRDATLGRTLEILG